MQRHDLGYMFREEVCVTWIKPPTHWLKLNSDGAFRLSSDTTGCGGLIRDDNGRWVGGFFRNIGASAVFKAKAYMWCS